jgi:GDP-L-fucose synthase
MSAEQTSPPIDPAHFAGRQVVVTGGRGFLGRYVCRLLTASGAVVHALGRQDYDLREQADVRRMYAELQPQTLIHLAAAVGGIGANVANPGRFLYENGLMGLMLLEEGRQAGLEKVVLISTTCAYPKNAPMPLQEDTIWDGKPVGATGPYGMAKRLLHEAVVTFGTQYGLKGVVLVPANLYGPEDHFDPELSHVIPGIIRRYIEAVETGAERVLNWGTGTPTREFLHVRDAARGIVLAAARHEDAAPVNLGTGVETPIRHLAEMVAEATGFTGEIAWDVAKPDGQPRRVLDTTRARAFGFEATVPLAEGLRETVAWYRAQTHAR